MLILVGRQQEAKRRAVSRALKEHDIASVEARNVPGNRKAESCTLALCCHKWFEERVLYGGIDPFPFVDDIDRDK